MNIGYARVSKAGDAPNLDLQYDALTKAGVAREFIYEDCALGKKDSRPGLAACLKALREGDTLVVWKLDRLGRDLHHLVSVVQELTKRGIGLRVLAGQGAQVDTATPAGRLVFGSAKKCGAIRQRMPRSRVSCPVHGSGGGDIVDACELLVDHRVDNPLYDPGRGTRLPQRCRLAVCGSCGHISARIRHCPTLFGTPLAYRAGIAGESQRPAICISTTLTPALA